MDTKSYKLDSLDKGWLLVDASDKTLGRLSTNIAKILMGKNKPEYTPHNDVGDYVVVINAEKIKVTGNKNDQKMYYRHTGYPGDSGGALVDSNGNLLGVINFIESTTGGNQGLNFAIPIDVVSESYSKILKETKR
jgi:ribosomal protein L13